MSTSSQLKSKLFEFLNTASTYAVLRNYEGLPLINKSRDIDILIEKNEFFNIENEIIKLIEDFEFKILTLYKSEKTVTYVCAKASNGIVDLVQLDFFFNTSLFGVILLDTSEMIITRLFNGAVYHVSKEYEFLDKYIQLKFFNKSYPKKYGALRNEMEKSSLLENIIKEVVGLDSLQELDTLSTSKLKQRSIISNLKKQPLGQFKLFFYFWRFYFKNMFSYKGFSIGFTGPDGSGKTTVIDLIVLELSKTYSDIQLFHFRPMVTPNLGEAAHKVKLKTEVDQDYSNPHRGEKTGKLNSLIRLLYYSVDYILGYFLKVRRFLQRRSLVIFDRYYTDVIADGRRSRIFLKPKFLYWFGKLFIPKLDYNILLTASKEVILARKQELDEAGINRINDNLIYLSDKNNYYLVLNEGSPSEAVQKILNIIFEEQHKKNMKRIR